MGLLGDYMPNWLPDDPNKNAAARQGLLAFGASLLGGRGNLGGILGDGIMAGSQGYHGALQQQQQQQLMATQQKRWDLENRETQAKLDEPAQFAQIMSGFGGSSSSAQESTPLSAVPQMSVPGAVGAPTRGPIQARSREQQYAEAMDAYRRFTAAGKPAQAKIYFDIAKDLSPKLKEQRTLTVDGKRVMVNVYDDGRTEQVEGFAPDLEKLVFADNGGTYNGRDAFTGEVKSTSVNSLSPEARANIEQRERERRSAEARVRTGAAPAGYRWTANGDLEPIPGGPVSAKISDPQQRMNDANSVVELLDMASPLIKTSTNSYLGTVWDEAARTVGSSTDGAQSAAQLKAIEGMLISKMPKMSGPQSDKDVLLYRQMAGQIGDRTIPEETKVAAMQTIRAINAKYLEGAGVKVPPAPGTVKNGYQFLGGNPADQKSWRKVQ